MNKKKLIIIIVSIIVGLAIIGGALFFVFMKNDDKKLICSYKDSEYEDTTTIYFKDNIEIKRSIDRKLIFDNELSAKTYYDTEKNISEYRYDISGNVVLLSYDENIIAEYALSYEEIRNNLKNNGYSCK